MAETRPDDDSELRRRRMVDSQLRTCDVTDQRLLAAFSTVPRENFVAPGLKAFAYMDRDIASLGAPSRMLLAPMTLARLIQAADVKPGERVLDVACGSGYASAILTELGARVTSLDSEEGAVDAAKSLLGAGAQVLRGDLTRGAPGQIFDVILVNGAFETMPTTLVELLAPGGRLVGVDATLGASRAALIERITDGLSARALFDVAAPRLEAFTPAPIFAF